MDEIENARIACEIANIRIHEIESLISDDYKEKRRQEYAIDVEKANFKYRREILIRTTLEFTIDNERAMFFKNAKALGQDSNYILEFSPKINVQEFPTIPNLCAQVKYWQQANEKLYAHYL
jgi:hypothetical protein